MPHDDAIEYRDHVAEHEEIEAEINAILEERFGDNACIIESLTSMLADRLEETDDVEIVALALQTVISTALNRALREGVLSAPRGSC